MNTAQTILEQIKALTPRPMLWSWGASKFQAVKPNQLDIKEDYNGGLLFYVRGLKHKGHVFVTLAYDDTYTVTIGNMRKGVMSNKGQRKDVYFEELPYIIDGMIEDTENNVEAAKAAIERALS